MSTSVVAILRALRGATSRHAFRGSSSYFRRSPDPLGPNRVRENQVHVFHDRKLSPHSTEGQARALQLPFLIAFSCESSLPIRGRGTRLCVDALKVLETHRSQSALGTHHGGGAGEDPYLGSCVAEAQVRGFQGSIPAELADT
jgi:hypothetical protein